MSFASLSRSFRFLRRAARKPRTLRRHVLPLRLEQLEDRVMLSIADMNYVEQTYRDVLRREGDAAGIAYWTAQVDAGHSGAEFAALIDHSAEYFGNIIITPAYLKYLKRPTDAAGVNYWTTQMQAGLRDEALEADLLCSQEYYDDAGGTDAKWLAALYRDLLGREPDPAGIQYWTPIIALPGGRCVVAMGFTNSLERARQRVTDDYQRYLGRVPDQTGIDYWVSQFAHGTTNEDIISGFVGSPEYFNHAQLPRITITAPTSGLLTKTNVTVSGQVNGANYPVTAFQAQVDSGAFNSVSLATDGSFSFMTTLALDGSADGTHTVSLKATNQAGYTSAPTGVSFTLDTQAPAVTITSPAAGLVTSSNVTVMGHVVDSTSGTATLQAQVDNGALANVTFDSGGNFSFTTALALDGSADGAHAVHFRATDNAGNVSSPVDATFTLDTTPPVLSLTSPANSGKYSGTVRLVGSASDALSGLASVQYSLDGSGVFATATVDAQGHFDQPLAGQNLALGSHQLVIEATDKAGNTSALKTISFNVTSTFTVAPAGSAGVGGETSKGLSLQERNSFLVQDSMPVQLGQTKGSRTLQFTVTPQFDTTDTTTVSGDRLLVYLVDPNNPSQTLLSGGPAGTALFTLTDRGTAEFAPGLVHWDGSTVQIDVTSLASNTSGNLLFQLVNGDSDTGSVVQIGLVSDTTDPNGTASPAMPNNPTLASAGAGLDLTTVSSITTAKVLLTNVRLDPAKGHYTADISVENDGPALGRTLVVLFPGLPGGVALESPSGTDTTGEPYVNFHDALPAGGLATGAVSMPIQVTFDDPSLLRFGLKPTILSAGPNQAPTLNAIMPLTVMPGGRLEVQLHGADADGDPLTYSLQSSGSLPNMTLDTTGLLVIQPAPGQLGNYSFTAVVSDGALQAMRTVALNVVADPVTTTRVSGLLMDVNQTPLAGVRLTIGSLQTTTAANGSFLLDEGTGGALPSDALSIYGNEITGPVSYPFVAEKLALLLGHDVYLGVNNVIARPIFLPKLDTAHGTMVDPNNTTTVAPSTIPGAMLTIAPHTLQTPQGTDFTGLASITQVPSTLTPAALPPNLRPSMVVTIQPGGMTFTTPAPLTLPNNGGFAPGTMMNLWSINPVTGFFDIAGTGQVSADGWVINTVTGGIHNSSWHFYSPIQAILNAFGLDPYTFDNFCFSCLVSQLISSNVEPHSGAVMEEHDLPTYQSLGAARGVNLVYDSLRADPRPIVHATYNSVDPSFYSVPSALRLVSKLNVDRGTYTYQQPGNAGGALNLTGGENFWAIPTTKGPVTGGLQVDMTAQPTGVYDYTLTSGILGYSAPGGGYIGSSTMENGNLVVVNDIASPFGSGWSIAGLQQVIPNPDGTLLLIDGDGSQEIFDAPTTSGGPFVSGPGDFSTMQQLADGTYQRTMTDQTVYKFNAQGLLTSMADRNGNTTSYRYDANGLLQTITDPVGLQTLFAYTGSKVSSITDPAGRVTNLSYDAAGNLTQITDPDNASVQYQYDTQHHQTAAIDKLGHKSQDVYDFAGRVTESIRADGSVIHVSPVETQGLYPAGMTFDPSKAPAAYVSSTAVSTYADGNGNVTSTRLDQFGQEVSASDGAGPLGTVTHNSQNEVTASTDGRGNQTTYTYDAKGNVLTQTDTLVPPDTALSFNGVQDVASIGNKLNMGISDFTLEVWIKGDPTMQDWGRILDKGYATGYEIGRVGNSDRVGFVMLNPDSSLNQFGTVSDVIDNTWHHIAVVKQGTTATIYADGVPEASETVSGAAQDNSLPLLIGYNPGEGFQGHWKGQIDELHIWGVARTTAEIQSDMRNLLTGTEPGLLASYSFNDGGGVARDATANHNDATLGAGVDADQPIYVPSTALFLLPPGPTDTALNFDGATQYASVGNKLNMGTSDFTLEAWIKGDPTMQAWGRIIDKGYNTAFALGRRYTSDQVSFEFLNSGSQGNSFTTTTDVIDGTWHYITVVKRGTTATIYADGVSENSETVSSAAQNNTLPLLIGYNPGEGYLGYWKGRLDDVGIWTVARTTAQIQSDMNNTLTGNEPGLAAYYRFNEGSGNTAFDATANHNDASLGNGVAADAPAYVLSTAPFVVITPMPSQTATQTYTYDPTFSQVTSYTDEIGRQTLYSIDPNNGNVLSMTQVVTGGPNVVTQYSYTPQGQLETETDPNGHVTQYQYDSVGRLMTLTLAAGTPDQGVEQFAYDSAGNLTSQTDERGNVTAYQYDALNRVKKVIEAQPNGGGPSTSPVTQMQYDAQGNLMKTIDADNNPTQYGYDALNRLTITTDANSNVSTLTYDSAGNVASATDERGDTTSYRYDARNRLIDTIDALGDPELRHYDYDNNLTAIIDQNGHETDYAYDARSRLVRTTDANGKATVNVYDAADQLTSVTDRNGHTTTYAYDDLGRQTKMTDAMNGVTTYSYDAAGNLVAENDPLNRKTQYAYDARDRNTSVTSPLGNVTSTTYDAVGNVVSVTDGRGNTIHYAYDALNRLTTQIDALGNSRTTAYDPVGNLVSTTDELGRTTQYTYDALDRLTKTTDPLGHVTQTGYDTVGNVTSTTDGLGNVTQYAYDALSRQTRMTDALGGVTAYTYDPVGNLMSLTDPVHNTTSYSYDALNRVTQETNPLGFSQTYGYDAVGNLTSETDRDGRVRQFTYDALNRQTAETWLDIETFNYTFDAASQLTAASDTNSSYSYSYDLDGRLTSVSNAGTAGVPTVVLGYSYDAANNQTQRTDTINGQLKGTNAYSYDALNRMTEIIQSDNGVTPERVDMTYDAASQMTGVTRYSDLAGAQQVAKSVYSYDNAGRLTALTHSHGATTIASYTWTYDAADRITQASSVDGTTNYTYDATDQLTGAISTSQPSENFSYDLNGNRTNTGYQTGPDNQLMSNGTFKYTYDKEGNRTSATNIATGDVTSYTWDYRNRLTQVTTKTAAGVVTMQATYTYDVFDRRIAKLVTTGMSSPVTERFVYDGAEIALAFDGTGTMTHRYLYGPALDMILADENAAGQVLWPLTDNLGTVRDLVNSSGVVQDHIQYDSFGQILTQTNAAVDLAFAYTGREYDPETGLYCYRARYYDPQAGQFLSEDPIGFGGMDVNLHRYVGNIATEATDPSGTVPTRKDTLTLDAFIQMVEKIEKANPGADPEHILEALLSATGDERKREVLGLRNRHRYLYTEDVGWIDLRHFIEAAGYSLKYGKRTTILGGYVQECGQFVTFKSVDLGNASSAFTYEDLPSNKQGAIFGQRLGFKLHPGSPVSEQLRSFLEGLSPRAPEKAPHFYRLFETEGAYEAAYEKGVRQYSFKDPTQLPPNENPLVDPLIGDNAEILPQPTAESSTTPEPPPADKQPTIKDAATNPDFFK
jgi:RHS repeat-associated protein